jgi:HK97 family phage major capsid protein
MNKFDLFLQTKGITSAQFAEKSAEDMAALYNEFNEASSTELAKAIESKATKEDIDALKSELAESQKEQMKQMNATMKEYGLAIKKLAENEKSQGVVNSIKTALESNKDAIAKLHKGENVTVAFKASATMLESTNVSGGNVPVEQRIAGLNTIASRQVRFLDIIGRGAASSNVISWVYQANKDGAAGATAEGATKNLIDFDLVVASESVVKMTAYIKVSTEMLSDIDFIETEINNELMRELMKVIEAGAYSGAGTTGLLHGVKTTATAFAAGDFAVAIDNANQVDVLAVAANQIAIANQSQPTAILMHPTDITKLKVAKVSSTDKRYIERLQMIGGSLSMDGIPMIPTTLVTAGEYLIGDFTKATLYEKEGVSVVMGLDGNDFTKNLQTIRAEWRGAVVVKTNDRTAFVKGVFATDMAALDISNA